MKRFLLLVVVSALAACAGGPETVPSRDPAGGGAGGDGGDDGSGGIGGFGGEGGSGGAHGELVPASRREVQFASAAADGFVHVGTLQIPEHPAGARLPAVIFAHGSGPHTRDEPLGSQLGMGFGVTIPVFAELGDALQAAGFVVLRFDKRSCGPFNGCADNGYELKDPDAITIDTFVEDVEGGLAFLAEQPEVDPARLFFVGHSKGASYAPRLLTDHPELRAGVMLAGPWSSIEVGLAYQAEKLAELMAATGATEAQIDAVVGPIRQQAEQLEELRAGTFAGTRIAGMALAYWRSWQRLSDEAPGLATALDRPLLVLSGDYDWNVPPDETEAWAAHFGDDSIHRARVLGCVTHALNCISQPDWKKIRPGDIGAHVDPQVIDAVVGFLAANR